MAISSIYRTVPKKFVMFYFSVKSKYINQVFFGTDYKKNLKHSNQVKIKQLVTGELTISRKYLSPEKASVFEYCSFSPS